MTASRRLLLTTFLLTVLVASVVMWRLLPPAMVATPLPHWEQEGVLVRGAYHVHSTQSDGSGSVEEIAAAAARAGLQFVFITDHGDATRVTPPRYLSGVLCIEAVEINTAGGHLVALGARPSPYPLAGTAEAVIEDVHRLGGLAVAAHPGSPRESLRWTDWTLPLDGVEWLNADSEWRDELLASLGRLLFTYQLRPVETLAATLDRPAAVMTAWDEALAHRRLVALAGADAHQRLGFRQQTDPYEEGWHLKVPTYEESFRTFGLRLVMLGGLSGDAAHDAAIVLATIRDGRAYTVVDGLATPGALEFSASSAGRIARMGDYLDVAGDVRLHVRMAAPDGARMVIRSDGEVLYDTFEREAHVGVPGTPAVYRVEVERPGAGVPWIVSNPIYVGMREAHRQTMDAEVPPVRVRQPVATEAWVAEASAASSSALRLPDASAGLTALAWTYALAPGQPSGQYAAVSFPVEGLPAGGRVQVRASADRPMRIWLQVRASGSGRGDRWGHSIYIDETPRTYDVAFDDLRPMGVTASREIPLARVDALLLVADTLNTRPGDSGQVEMTSLWLVEP